MTASATEEVSPSPQWEYIDETPYPTSFILTLLTEPVPLQLIQRGYAVVQLVDEISQLHTAYYSANYNFFKLLPNDKNRFRIQNFDTNAKVFGSQLHG